jgi:vacuolar protein sorting-associated protein 13A/C
MFEGKLTSVLNKLLGEYVHGISAKDLSVAVFKGDVVLKNLRLKTEALNALDLPFAVRSGLVGKLSLQIPWRALGKQPVVATIERLYVVAGFADDVDGTDALTVEERTERWERAKAELRRRTVDEGESKWLESAAAADGTNDAAMDKDEDAAKGGDGWLAGMLDTVLGNLEVNISKIHVRLEGDLAAAAKDTSN